MADFIARGTQSSISSGGVAIPSTNLRQELVTEENVARWVAEGRVWTASVGTINTPATFLGAALAVATPELAVLVAAGKYIIPLEVSISFITGTTAPTNVAIITAQNSIGNGTSTAGSDTNMNTNFGGSSGLTVRITYSGAGTAATAPAEIWRASSALMAVATVGGLANFHWGWKTNVAPRIGSSSVAHTFQVNTGGAAGNSGYIQASYALFTFGDN